MRVEYLDIVDLILNAVKRADERDMTIKRIVVSQKEWNELYNSLPDDLARRDAEALGQMTWWGCPVFLEGTVK